MQVDLLTFEEAHARAVKGDALSTLISWVRSYPVSAHDALGRAGPVCPFTERARGQGTLRFSISTAGSHEEKKAFTLIRRGFKDLNEIPAAARLKELRAVIIGFPNCNNPEGIAMLQRVDKRHKYYGLVRMRTIGFMHPLSDTGGIWNPAFKPMLAPMPVMIIRCVVEQDAPFIAHHRLSMAPYILRYGIGGARRLRSYRRRVERMRAHAKADAKAG
ncbi:MAG: DUF6875 domain-containing protein [Hyphomonadaceae bacterium]